MSASSNHSLFDKKGSAFSEKAPFAGAFSFRDPYFPNSSGGSKKADLLSLLDGCEPMSECILIARRSASVFDSAFAWNACHPKSYRMIFFHHGSVDSNQHVHQRRPFSDLSVP